MRPAIPFGLAIAVSAAPVPVGHDGYLAVVGPKPLVFSRPGGTLSAALAKLPPLPRQTPDPRQAYVGRTNDPVILPPPSGANGGGGTGDPAWVGPPFPGSGDPGLSPDSGSAGTESSSAPGLPSGATPPGAESLLPGVIPGQEGLPTLDLERGFGLFSPQMLLPFFRTPAAPQRSNQVYLSIPFMPARPAPLPPAASSSATYEQH